MVIYLLYCVKFDIFLIFRVINLMKKITSAVLAVFMICFCFCPVAVNADSELKALINSNAGTAVKTGCIPLDNAVDELFAKIFTSEMTAYDKVKAVYDYMVVNYSGGSSNTLYPATAPDIQLNVADSDIPDYFAGQDAFFIKNAAEIIATHKGTCLNYTAAFAVFMKSLGLDCFPVKGMTASAGGGMTEHFWPVVVLNGKYYIFDAQVDDHIANGGNIRYWRFGYTVEELSDLYVPYKSYDSFNVEFGRFDYEGKTVDIGTKTDLIGFVFKINSTGYADKAAYDSKKQLLYFACPIPVDDFYFLSDLPDSIEGVSNNICISTGNIFTDRNSEKYICIVMGDIDKNGKITSSDARSALKYSLRLCKLDSVSLLAADIDRNNKISSNDARVILRVALKLSDVSLVNS